MKCLLAPCAVVAALALSSCGSSSTLSSDQYTGLLAQGKEFATSIQTVEADASSCAAGAAAGSNTPPDLSIVKTCLGDAAGKAQTGLTKIISYTNSLSGEVDGTCSTDLKALSAAMTDVKAIFAKVEGQARAGDLAAMQTTLQSIKSTNITSAGAAAEKACKA